MAWNSARSRVLFRGASVFAVVAGFSSTAMAQEVQTLDAITVTATKTEEKAIDSLAAVSVVTSEQIQQTIPNRLSDVFYGVPSVSFHDRGDEPGTAFNIRGLQDFGRVNVLIDGARQNFQQSGHNANGYVYFDPELLTGADIVRGPVANIYGSGAIGGVVALRTKDIEDVVRAGERWGVVGNTAFTSNGIGGLASMFAGARANPNVDLFGGVVFRKQGNYENGNGLEIQNTGSEVKSAIAKTTFRPADGHQIKLSGVFYDAAFDTGQSLKGYGIGTTNGFSIFNSNVRNYTAGARWTYARPDDPLFDWDANIYWNRTDSEQLKIGHSLNSQGNNITGNIGDRRTFKLDTIGFDANNTTRMESGNWFHAFTYGADAFRDSVETFDPRGAADVTTPSGDRTVSGAFLQWRAKYQNWLEVISALRYDNYSLDGQGVSSSGDRLSPKITVGVTPVAGFTPYATYAEGYRAPALTETLVSGTHPAGSPMSGAFQCPDGNLGFFCFLPNPGLRPEVGKNKEIGINLRYDDIFQSGDSFRGKINLFRNDIDNYIELTAFGPCSVLGYGCSFRNFMQYQNIPSARIDGFEFETNYDAGWWYAGLSGQWLDGKDVTTGIPLATIPANRITTTLGTRLLDRKLTLAVKWSAVSAQDDVPATYIPTGSYNLINLYVGYQPTPDILASFTIDNLLNEYYLPYAPIRSDSSSGSGGNLDQQFAASAPGRVYKGSLRIRFGAI